jgi:glutamyl-tRNA reductase
MAVLALGISYRRADVELLERLAFSDDDLVKAYRRAADDPAIDEATILSTCNRVEVYGSVPSYHTGFQTLKRLICETRGISAEILAEPLYSHYEVDAAEHLFGVASGLDSMVIGEPQILTQVRDALKRAQREAAAGPVLTGLFHAASRTGRRVRSETSVGAAPDTFVDAGAELGAHALGGLEGKRVVVIGAGQMSALAVKHLRRRGVGRVGILNRSIERARALAERTSAEHGDLGDLLPALAAADLVVSATGAAGMVLDEASLRRAMQTRTAPMFVLDLAVPRDVEPSSREIPNVTVADIDDLRTTASVRGAATSTDIARAHEIVDEEVHRFTLRRRAERLAPLIHALRERGETVVEAELRRFRSNLADLTPDEREAVEALARGIVAKLLHEPIVRLKELSAPGTEDQHARMLAELLGVELPTE